MTSGELKWCKGSNQRLEGAEMIFVIGLVLVLMIVTNFWMERRICTLEQRWNDYIAEQHSSQGPSQLR
jgi:hypothetical protein